MRDPQQEIFTALVKTLRAAGYDVYDGLLPSEDAPYPFIYLGETMQTDTGNKSSVFSYITQTIHVWHNNYNKRGELSAMLLDIKQKCRNLKCDGCPIYIRNMSQQILDDTTTSQPLMHAVIDAEWVVG